MRKAYAIKVEGRVQGVGFRFYTVQKAHELGIKGFVENKPDGSVYIEDEGIENHLLEFVQWCHKGPSWARVQKVSFTEMPAIGLTGFKIK